MPGEIILVLDASEQIRARRFKCNPRRRTQRKGCRGETRVGESPLPLPTLWSGSSFSRLLEPRRL